VAAVAIVAVAGFAWAWDRSSQPTAGDGWQLLGRQRSLGEAGSARTIADADRLAEVWASLLLRDPPRIDFATHAVLWLVPVGSIGCPSRLDGVTFDAPGRTVTGSFSLGLSAGCDRVAVADSFVVAVDRRRLPAEPFAIRLIGP
jgi:hypothetical protein